MQIRAVIDRFEGQWAVLLAGNEETPIRWPKTMLPNSGREGDILTIALSVDHDATRRAKEEAEDLLRTILEQQSKE